MSKPSRKHKNLSAWIVRGQAAYDSFMKWATSDGKLDDDLVRDYPPAIKPDLYHRQRLVRGFLNRAHERSETR